LLLDEPGSALDTINEKKLMERLATLQITRILVTHRLRSIQDANRMIVIDQGRVVEEESFHNLSTRDSYFRRLLKKQNENL
jgi:ABC-type multidrug transport system fused ATPase/permease subunit